MNNTNLHTVPISASTVSDFMKDNAKRYKEALHSIQDIVKKSISSKLSSSYVYKIYDRSDKQEGEITKSPRKIRLKFNENNKDEKSATSLWSVPDIIGFTIVVNFPSDINEVCTLVDALIDRKDLSLGYELAKRAKASKQSRISSKYGRELSSAGYFACHYNVALPGPTGFNRPICEIQIKTILHDAWGVKTHDLTYKPSGKTSQELIALFNLLGDALAKLDQQTDVLNGAIAQAAAARKRKKHKAQTAAIEGAATLASETCKDFANIFKAAQAPKQLTLTTVKKYEAQINQSFAKYPRESSVICAFLALKLESPRLFSFSLELFQTWFEIADCQLDQSFVRHVQAIACFSGDDISAAIEALEEAIELATSIKLVGLNEHDQIQRKRILNASYSSLAWLHADRIGSYEGNQQDSHGSAIKFAELSQRTSKELGLLDVGIQSDDLKIKQLLDDPRCSREALNLLENDAFVCIQTCQSEAGLRILQERLEFVLDSCPVELKTLAESSFEFYEYCARSRLAELEASAG